MRGDRTDAGLTSQTEPRCQVRQNGAQIGAWVNDAGEQSGGDAEQFHQLVIPLAVDAEQSGSGSIGAFGDLRPGEPVADQIGDQQSPIGSTERPVPLIGGQLVQRVEREEL